MKKKKKNNHNLDPNNPDDVDFVCDVWDMFDDDDISTEKLVAMTCDYLHIDSSDLYDFLLSKKEKEN